MVESEVKMTEVSEKNARASVRWKLRISNRLKQLAEKAKEKKKIMFIYIYTFFFDLCSKSGSENYIFVCKKITIFLWHIFIHHFL